MDRHFERYLSLSLPRSSRKGTRARPLRILVLGATGVGKTAMVVRFLTRRFIYEYDSSTERKYCLNTDVEGPNGAEPAFMEILDTLHHATQTDTSHLESQIKWADVFLLVFSVTDRCAFEEITRLRFLILHYRKPRRATSGVRPKSDEIPIFIVGTKNDLTLDRVVSLEDANIRTDELNCLSYFDISSKESVYDARKVFNDVYWRCRQIYTYHKHFRGMEDVGPCSPPLLRPRHNIHRPSIIGTATPLATENNPLERTEMESQENVSSPERKRKKSVGRRIIDRMLPSFTGASMERLHLYDTL